jgi:hypothetical protein
MPEAHTYSESLVDWSESTVIITKTTDCYRSKPTTTTVLYSEGRMRLVPVALYANGCPRWHIINSITNLSNNPRKPLVKQRQSSEREFVVVLLLTPDRAEQKEKMGGIATLWRESKFRALEAY